MARDKLITIRIEGEKRDLFNQLAKSQNTDTASLLYDFISGCLSGTLDVGIVTGKKQRIDKIANQIDSERIDKLETTTQRLDNWIGALSGRLNDWISAIDDRLTDSDQGLSEKIISLEHRLNALAIQLDSQKDSQEMTTQKIDTDSQKDSQRIDDMEHLLKREKECSIASPIPTIEETSPLPPSPDVIDGSGEAIEPVPTVEDVNTDSTVETVTDAIENENRETSPINDAGEGAIEDDREWLTLQQIADKKIKGLPGTQQGLRLHAKNWESRKNPQKRGEQYKIPKEYLK